MTITRDDLKRLHTRQLLNALRDVRTQISQANHSFRQMDEQRPITTFLSEVEVCTDENSVVEAYLLGRTHDEGSEVTVVDLKAELATREHVPNKQEAKEIRRKKAQANRGQGRRNR
jgi:hypothetical protein